MVERVELSWAGEGMDGALARHALLERLRVACEGRGVEVLAFGFAHRELRLVLRGARTGAVLHALKSGTTRWMAARTLGFEWGCSDRSPADDTGLAIAWAHTVADDPLATPWTSYRDHVGARRSGLVRPVGHERLRLRPRRTATREPLPTLLRVTAGVLGVLPPDRVCFPTFVHLAKKQGWRTCDIAVALGLTPRRVRQLAAAPAPALRLAEQALAHPRLRQG